MNDQIILTIAQAILKNTEVLQSLVDMLPHEAREAVTEKVTAGKSATKKAAPEPVPVATPFPAAVAQPAAASPSETFPQQPAAPAPQTPPTPAAPVPTPAAPVQQSEAAPAAASTVPFTDGQGLIKYVMEAYQKMGPTKGAEIQKVLVGLGHGNINDVPAKDYAALYQQVEALKGGA